MLLSHLISSTLAVIAALTPSALAMPQDDVSPQSLDVKLQWHSKTNCIDSGGPKREYSAGPCMPLPESTHGVDIVDRRGSCYSKQSQ